MICFAAIAPHGDPAFVEGSPTRLALEEAGRRLAAAAPEAVVVLTPHNVHVEGAFGVVLAARLVGEIAEDGLALSLTVETDRALADSLLAGLRRAELPAVRLSYGSNDLALAEHPLDWGAHIPLEFLGRDARQVVVISPARELPLGDHVRAGAAIAAASDGRRVALVASADHGHAHDPEGPYGFDPAAAEYDARLQEIVASGRLDFLPLAELAEPAKADSLWQLLVLQGAVGETARADVLGYAAPTYYGMLVAEVQTAA